MTGRLWGDRRAEAFQNALDGHVDLAEHELTEFVQFAHAMRDAPPVTLGSETRSAIRARLVTEAEAVLGASEVPAPPTRPRRRRAVRAIAGSTAAAAALSAGLVTVSADALPGDVLYPIKRGVEQLEITFGGGGASAGSVHLDHASERLDEAMALARSGGDADRISGALRDFTADTRAGAEQLLRAYASNDDTAAIADIRSFTREAAGQLRVLSPMLGESTDTAYTTAVKAVETADRRAIEACPTCAGGPAVQVPYMVDPIGRVDALPYIGNGNDGAHDADGQDDLFADPQNLPNDTDLPPIEGQHDQHHNGNGDHGDETTRPKLHGGSGTDDGSSSIDEPDLDSDKGHDDGTVQLPDLPTLPDTDGVIRGDLGLGSLEDILGPVEDLLGPLGPLGDLLGPLLGGDSKSGPEEKDDQSGHLDGLLGPVLGGDRDSTDGEAKPDKVEPTQDGTSETTPDNSGGDDQGQQDQDDGPLDDLIGPVDETDEAPEVDQNDQDEQGDQGNQDDLDGLTGEDEGSTPNQDDGTTAQ